MKINVVTSYLLGLVLLAIGIVFAIKASFGITVTSSLPYVLSLKFGFLSLGVLNYMVQGVLFVILVVLMRHFKRQYLIAFGTSVLFGYILDSINFLMRPLAVNSMVGRGIVFIVSIWIISLALVFLIKSQLPIMPSDLLVREVSSKYSYDVGKLKMIVDLLMLSTSVTLSFLFFKSLNGIGIGTIISAFTIGPCIGLLMKGIGEKIEVSSIKEGSLISKAVL